MSDSNTTWPRATTDTGNGVLSYHRTGGEKPVALLLHGLTDNSLCWTRVARSLANNFDVILLDSPGHGFSDLPAGSGKQAPAKTIASLIDALKISAPVVMGHSIGAIAAAEFAATYPLVPASVILEDPPFRRRMPPEISAEQVSGFEQETARLKAMSKQALFKMGREQYPDWDELDLIHWAEAKHQVNGKILGRYQFPTWQACIEPIQAPTLLLYGDPGGDGIVSPELARSICAANPVIQAMQVPGAGHQIHRTHFDTCIKLIGEFLGVDRDS